ncbi:MAG TPA: type II toxin-antitoxin system RelE/ParE family toxin [Microthrixaceae bacterium]|nr:type II toxin-antitoxin system RelE/ParE family toxin [Microthrixaceae bacterium]
MSDFSDATYEWEHFTAESGADPIKKAISKAKLSRREAAGLVNILERVARNEALPGDVKQLRGRIWEVRLSGDGTRIFRLLYARSSSDAHLVLLGLQFFQKKSAKCPPADIKRAEKRLAEWERRDWPGSE